MFGKWMIGERKGWETSVRNLVVVLIVVMVTIVSLYKFAPQIKGIIIKLLKFDLGEPHTGDCARKCSEIEDAGHDLGEITLTESGDVCGHDDLENVGRDFFKFTVAKSGEVTVTFQPEYWKENSFYSCYEPTLTIYSGECGSLKFEAMDSPLFGMCPGIYNPVGDAWAIVEFYAEEGVTYYAELNGRFGEVEPGPDDMGGRRIIVSLVTCEMCVNAGKEWCEHPTKEGARCFDKCTKGLGLPNCPGVGICIKDNNDYCTPSVCEGKPEAECIADPWCKPCPQCENYKINEYGEFKCVGVFDSCDYLLCNHDICGAECDLLNPCSSSQELCSSENCECETKYCCNCQDGSYLCTISSFCSSTCSFGQGNFGNPCSDREQCKGGPFP